MASGIQPRHQSGANAVHLRREVNEGTGIKVLRITAIVVSILAAIVSWIVLPWGIALGVTGAAALVALCCCCCRNRRIERIENLLPRQAAAPQVPVAAAPVIIQEVPVAPAPVFIQEPVVVLPAQPLPARRLHWFRRDPVVVDARPRELVADPYPRIDLPERRVPNLRPRRAEAPRERPPMHAANPLPPRNIAAGIDAQPREIVAPRERPPIPAANPLPPRNVAAEINAQPRELVAPRERPPIPAANPLPPRNVAAGINAQPRELVAPRERPPMHAANPLPPRNVAAGINAQPRELVAPRERPPIPAANPLPPRDMIHFPGAPGGALGGVVREIVRARR